MSNFAADYLIDRRRLRRQLTTWRVIAIILVIAAILIAAFRLTNGVGSPGPYVAKLEIKGLIVGDDETLKKIRNIADSRAAAAIISIDSPGGTTEGSEVLYEELRRLAAKKPVAAVVGSMATSGAYIAALGADRIFAHGNSIVGSIGVLVQYPNFSGLMDKIGVKYEAIKSSPLKATPNGFEPTSEASRDAIAAVVSDSYAWFKDLVRERRALNDDELAKVSDGRVFDGRQGLPLKLIDSIGGEQDAVKWLEQDKGVAKGLPIRDVSGGHGLFGMKLSSVVADFADAAGANSLARTLRAVAFTSDGAVDGLVSVWQFSSAD